MKIDYNSFRKEYEQSGLSQRKFGELNGMSASMVSYYLKQSKEDGADPKPSFAKLEVIPSISTSIVITMPNGVIIKLPV